MYSIPSRILLGLVELSRQTKALDGVVAQVNKYVLPLLNHHPELGRYFCLRGRLYDCPEEGFNSLTEMVISPDGEVIQYLDQALFLRHWMGHIPPERERPTTPFEAMSLGNQRQAQFRDWLTLEVRPALAKATTKAQSSAKVERLSDPEILLIWKGGLVTACQASLSKPPKPPKS